MIPRKLAPTLLESARLYPVVTLTGPRQSGWDEHAALEPYLVHGGDTRRTVHGVRALPWTELSTITCA